MHSLRCILQEGQIHKRSVAAAYCPFSPQSDEAQRESVLALSVRCSLNLFSYSLLRHILKQGLQKIPLIWVLYCKTVLEAIYSTSTVGSY